MDYPFSNFSTFTNTFYQFGLDDAFSPLLLAPELWIEPSYRFTLFQDAIGTIPVTSTGDPVGLVLDKSGNSNNLTAPSDAARPIYTVADNGNKLLQNDEIDDQLSVTLPDLGTDVTIAYTTQSELRINENETVGAGEYTLPQVDLLNYLMIDRQLTKSEKIELIRYLSRSADGVNYGAVIDDMILACLNAIDVFVYDTTKDSDGGAWRTGSLAKVSSWYNETLNTATRGSRREFPQVAVIVAESNKVTIYDGDDPALPMWMVFTGEQSSDVILVQTTGASTTSVSAVNGTVSVGTQSNGCHVISFIADLSERAHPSLYNTFISGIESRNGGGVYSTGGGYNTVNSDVNDVAMTVLPDAPIDPATGLPVPTIAVATDGGVSVITDSGAVWDVSFVAARNFTDTVDFTADNWILATTSNVSTTPAAWFPVVFPIPTADITNVGTSAGGNGIGFQSVLIPPLGASPFEQGNAASASKDALFIGKPSGLWTVPAVPDDTLSVSQANKVALVTSTYNTGWMNGDIKGAFLSDTDDTDLVGGNILLNGDFSSGSSNFVVIGAGFSISDKIIASSVPANTYGPYADNATQVSSDLSKQYRIKADVVVTSGGVTLRIGNAEAITCTSTQSVDVIVSPITNNVTIFQVRATSSGFTGSVDNIVIEEVEQDRSVNNNGLLVNGTVTRSPVATGAELVAYSGFSASNYLEQPYNPDLDFGTGDFCIMGWGNVSSSAGGTMIGRYAASSTAPDWDLRMRSDGIMAFKINDVDTVVGTTDRRTLTWVHTVVVRQSGTLHLYENGVLVDSAANTTSLTNLSARLGVGVRNITSTDVNWDGSLALLRISATAPTTEQIAKIYEDELPLFQENAACTLYGTSNAVAALAHDPDTDLLHVGTSAGRSVFRGLERIQNTSTSVSRAISASGGLVAEK